MAKEEEEGMDVDAAAQLPAEREPAILFGDLPAFFPTISRAPPEPRPLRKLNGADDLLGRLHLVPLYNATVKQFLRNAPDTRGGGTATGSGGAPVATAATATTAASGGNPSTTQAAAGLPGVDGTGGASGNLAGDRGVKRGRNEEANPFLTHGPGGNSDATAAKRKGLPKTIENYVAELPGRVMPPRKLLSKPDYHEHTMREIIYRPETTIQNIVPFDRETLESAFRVSAGDVPGIDHSLLEPDQMESSSPRKKKKTKTKQKQAKA